MFAESERLAGAHSKREETKQHSKREQARKPSNTPKESKHSKSKQVDNMMKAMLLAGVLVHGQEACADSTSWYKKRA